MADPVAATKGAVSGIAKFAKAALPLVGIAGLVCIGASDMGISGYFAKAAEGGSVLASKAVGLFPNLG